MAAMAATAVTAAMVVMVVLPLLNHHEVQYSLLEGIRGGARPMSKATYLEERYDSAVHGILDLYDSRIP